jgi:hypothetical protein
MTWRSTHGSESNIHQWNGYTLIRTPCGMGWDKVTVYRAEEKLCVFTGTTALQDAKNWCEAHAKRVPELDIGWDANGSPESQR